ncbi:MAG: aspartate dehydrogenase [Candidatus Omnitrophota bacterium]|nr:aspartate dehydrogenase [Candidatus Omnitrophota bacterium]
MKKIIGIIGCGTIGTAIIGHVDKELRDKVSEILVCDKEDRASRRLAGSIEGCAAVNSIEDIISGADLIVEAASPAVAGDIFKKVLEAGKDVIFMSIGGLLDKEDLFVEAERRGIRVMLPSGAISGIDALKASKIAGITSVELITRKPPKALAGAPYVTENGIDLDKLQGETVIFEGTAREAMKGFPKNINVAALLSLAGIGADRTKVKIIADPSYCKNVHEVIVESKAGRLVMRTENVPSPDNPKTSYLASLAAMATIDAYFGTVRIGT